MTMKKHWNLKWTEGNRPARKNFEIASGRSQDWFANGGLYGKMGRIESLRRWDKRGYI